MIRVLNQYEQFVQGLINEVPIENRCPHLRVNDSIPYCSKDYKKGSPIEEERQLVCNHFALQLWCLDKKRCNKCTAYQGEPFRQ